MYGFYSHFNNLRFNNATTIRYSVLDTCRSLLVSSTTFKCRLLRLLLDHPMNKHRTGHIKHSQRGGLGCQNMQEVAGGASSSWLTRDCRGLRGMIIDLSLYPSISLSLYIYIYTCIDRSIYLSIYLSILLPICNESVVLIYVSLSLYIYIYIWLYTYTYVYTHMFSHIHIPRRSGGPRRTAAPGLP